MNLTADETRTRSYIACPF